VSPSFFKLRFFWEGKRRRDLTAIEKKKNEFIYFKFKTEGAGLLLKKRKKKISATCETMARTDSLAQVGKGDPQ